jgi:hypothetical protein
MKPLGTGIILTGDEGIGKSSLAAQFPKPILGISVKEMGFTDLIYSGEIKEGDIDEAEASDWKNLLSLLKEPGDASTVIVDSLSGVAQYMKEDILQNIYDGSLSDRLKSFGSFSEGWRIHAPTWAERMAERLTKLRTDGVNVVLIAHNRNETVKNATGNDYEASVIDMEKWPRAVFTKWAQAVLFLTMDFGTKGTKKWKGKVTESKVEEELDEAVDRVIYTTKHPSHSAKNRLGLPVSIPMGETAEEAYNNLVSEFPPLIQEHLHFSPK